MKLKRSVVNSPVLLSKVKKMSPIKEGSDFITWENMIAWGKKNNGKLYAWFLKGKIMAAMFVNVYKDLVMISNFEVSKNFKHQGIGSYCFKQIQTLYKNKTIILEIKKHTTLRKFYKHFGILPIINTDAYSSKDFNLLSSDPNLDSWKIQTYFWKEDESWNRFNHERYDKIAVSEMYKELINLE